MHLQQRKRQLLILMILLLFVSQACTDIFVPGLPEMSREFGSTIKQMNLTISVYIYAQAFFFLIIGVISDLFGRRRVLLTCIPLQIIASFAIAMTNSLDLVIILRVIQALGSSAIYIVLRLVIKDTLDREEQIHATGVLLIGLVLSPALAPVIGAHLINLWSWRACFILIGMVMTGLLIWLAFLLPETNSKIKQFRSEFSFKNQLSNYAGVLQDKLFITLIILVGGTFASYYGFIAISSYMYIDEYHISNTLYSYSYVAIAAAYLLGNRIMLWLNKEQVLPWRIIQYGIVISCIGVGLMITSFMGQHNVFFVLGLATFGSLLIRLATAFINPPIQVLVMNYFGNAGSNAIGLLSCLQYVFAGFGTAVVSDLPFSPSTSLVVSSIIFTLISLIGYYFCPYSRIQSKRDET